MLSGVQGKHMCIDKSKSKDHVLKSCREHRHTGAGNEAVRKVAKLVIPYAKKTS